MPDTVIPISRKKKLLFSLIVVTAMGVLAEAAARVGYFVRDGLNPYYLVFGFVPDTEFHSLQGKGYSKFHPGSVKRQKYGDRLITMKINSLGFRRTGESDPPAAEAGLRIATLGASSTFGYHVEDHEAYPAVLERLLRGSHPRREVQVYNFGVPHLRLEGIVELARHELPPIRPAVVTLYCGYNNVGQQKRGTREKKAASLKDWLYFHSVLYRAVRPVVKTAYFSLVRTTNKDLAQLGHLSLPLELSRGQVEALRATIPADFAVDLERLHELIESMGATLVLVTQNYNLKGRKGSGLNDRWRTYDEEVRLVEGWLVRNGRISAVQSSLLIHRDLMERLRSFAEENGNPLVDGIAALARDPSQMASGVHLSPLGNQWIAEAIHDEIWPLLEDEGRPRGESPRQSR